MGQYKVAITKGAILRDNIVSSLVLLLIVCCFGAWVHVNNKWQGQGIRTTATVISIQDSEKGRLAVIQWQANGRLYSRATDGHTDEVGSEQEVRYLPAEPSRALTVLEVDGEAARIIGTPALVVFGLIQLLGVWLRSGWGPRRADDDTVVAEITERD